MPGGHIVTRPMPGGHIVTHVPCQAGIADRVPVEKININKAANRSDDFQKLNPMGEVPALLLASGSVLSESLVICRYLEEVRTGGAGSPLHGASAAERAETDIWAARMESKYLVPLFWAVRSSSGRT